MDYRINDASYTLDCKIKMVHSDLTDSFKNLESYTKHYLAEVNNSNL